jgi:hypothetical protein
MRGIVCRFSAYTNAEKEYKNIKTKNKFRNQLNAASDLRISLSGITQDLKTVMKKNYENIPIFSLNLS